jgi:hypothetical protein
LSKATNAIVSETVSVDELVSWLNSQSSLTTPSGEAYRFYSNVSDAYDVKNMFSVLVQGRISPMTRVDVFYSIIQKTWKNTANNPTTTFVQQSLSRGYRLIFVDSENYLLDANNQFYTSIAYFVTNGTILNPNDFNQIPNYRWFASELQNTGYMFNFPDPADKSLVLQEYSSFYSVDFNGYVDPSSYKTIQQTIADVFTRTFEGKFYCYFLLLSKCATFNLVNSKGLTMNMVRIVLNERRVGQFGNNVTRLLYNVVNGNNIALDKDVYPSPTVALNVNCRLFDFTNPLLNLKAYSKIADCSVERSVQHVQPDFTIG